MDEQLAAELKEAEAAVVQAEKELGANHPELADKLQRYANLLRKTERRALDAVNVEARARAIRARILAEDEAAHGIKPAADSTKATAKPVKKTKYARQGMYFGFAAIFLALASLVLNEQLLPGLITVAIVLAITDAVLSRSGFWRGAVTAALAAAAWWCSTSVPSSMLPDESPINRFNYASDNPELVTNIRKLAKPTPVLSFKICLPEGYSAAGDEVKDWGRVLTYSAPRAEGAAPGAQSPEIRFALIKLPAAMLQKGKARATLLKSARDVVMPHLTELGGWQSTRLETPRYEDINGMQFVRLSFFASGINGASSCFAYVTPLNRTLFVIFGQDPTTDADAGLPLMESAVYTVKRISAAEPELE